MRRQASTNTNEVDFTAPQIQEDEDKAMAEGTATQIQEDEDKAMAEGTATPRPTAAKPAAKTDSKDTITLTFQGQDKALFDKIEAAAAADERTPAKYLLIQIRKQFQ